MDRQLDRTALFHECRAEISKRQLSNAENFDKAMLSLATGGLGFTIIFLKDPVSHATPWGLTWLKASAVLFVLTIITSLGSYVLSQIGLSRQLANAKRYLLDGDDNSIDARNAYIPWTSAATFGAGAVFVFAIISAVTFVWSLDIPGERVMYKEPTGIIERGAPMPAIPSLPRDSQQDSSSKPSDKPAEQELPPPKGPQ